MYVKIGRAYYMSNIFYKEGVCIEKSIIELHFTNL